MKKIQVSKFKTSLLNVEFNSIHVIEVGDQSFDRGGFGEVFLCQSVNGKPATVRQVIKIFNDDGSGSAVRGYDTIIRFQDNIIAQNRDLEKRGEKLLQNVTLLGALPQFSFEGLLEGQTVLGYSANYLEAPTWTLFSHLFDDQNRQRAGQLLNEFYNLPLDLRIKMAYLLAEGFLHLEQMKFIYADLNPANLFINQRDGEVCLIDYEGGAINDNPETFGKLGEWLAPEIMTQLTQNNTDRIKVDLNTDTWAVAIAIHFMFFHFHPLFFLQVIGNKEITDYLQKYKWPAVSQSEPNFRQELAGLYQTYIHKLQTRLSPSLFTSFANTINKGFNNPNLRLSYKQWMNVLAVLMEPPVILEFSADRTSIMESMHVTLNWKVEKAQSLFIDNGVGDVTGKDQIKVKPGKSVVYHLTATGHFGNDTKKADITVYPIPTLNILNVPVPDFNINIVLESNYTRLPEVSFTKTFDTEKLTQVPMSFVRLEDIPVEQSFFKNNSAFWSITHVFNKIKEGLLKQQ